MNERKPFVSEQPDEILNRPPATGDLTAELKQTKRSVSKLTIGLIGAVLLAGAFFGGIATHAAVADSPQPAAQGARQQLPRGTGGGQGTGGQNGQAGPRGTIGTIDRIEGADIYVKTADGRTVKVSTSDSTQVRVSQEGRLSDLKQGEAVAVQGSTGSDGSVTAQTITQQPARQR